MQFTILTNKNEKGKKNYSLNRHNKNIWQKPSQNPFIEKSLCKLGIELLQSERKPLPKPIASMILNGKIVNIFPLWSETKILFSLLLFNIIPAILEREIRQETEIKIYRFAKKNLSRFISNNMII